MPAVLNGPFRDRDICEPESVTVSTSILQCLEQDVRVLTLIGSFLDCSGFSANSLLDEATKDPGASETTRQLVVALSDLEKSRGRAAGHLLCGAITLDANLKLLRHNDVLSAASLSNTVAKEAYHLPLEPTSSGLFGEGLSRLLERSDKLTVEKRQKAFHKAVVRSVKIDKMPAQHKAKHPAPGSGQKKGQFRKKKRPAKKGGQPFKKGQPISKGCRKWDAHP